MFLSVWGQYSRTVKIKSSGEDTGNSLVIYPIENTDGVGEIVALGSSKSRGEAAAEPWASPGGAATQGTLSDRLPMVGTHTAEASRVTHPQGYRHSQTTAKWDHSGDAWVIRPEGSFCFLYRPTQAAYHLSNFYWNKQKENSVFYIRAFFATRSFPPQSWKTGSHHSISVHLQSPLEWAVRHSGARAVCYFGIRQCRTSSSSQTCHLWAVLDILNWSHVWIVRMQRYPGNGSGKSEPLVG